MTSELYTVIVANYARALILKTMLETEGIHSVLSNVNVIQSTTSSGVKLRVGQKDLERAMAIVKEFEDDKTDKIYSLGDSRIEKILVPVDFSNHSRNAALYAIHIARQLESSEIQFLYIYYAPDPNAMAYSESFIYHDQVSDQMVNVKEKAESGLKNFLKDIESTAGENIPKKLKLTYALEQGMASDAILIYSRHFQPGLIVIGAKGVGNREEFLGSSTIRIILKASFPVLVIPERSQIKKDKTSLKIVYATNYDEYDFFAIGRLIRLFESFSLEIFCTHIGMEDESIEKLKMKALLDYFEKSYPKVKIHCSTLKDQGVEVGLDKCISEQNIDILAMTTHKRNLLTKIISPSITKKVYYHTRIPLLIFHSTV